MTKVGGYAIDTSTTLESNKSHPPFPGYPWSSCLLPGTLEKACPWKNPLPRACLTLSRP